jgi:cystathionine beta-lyase
MVVMGYDFDRVIDRCNTNSMKWDLAEARLGCKGLLPMWVADMDFRAPDPVIQALRVAAEHGIYGYAARMPSYYESFINWMKKRYGWEVKREWVECTPGVVPALHLAVRAFTRPGDEVIVQTPVYYPFFNAVTSTGRIILNNPLRLENGQYVMDLADLERKLTSRTKMMLLCSPHNPGGRVWTRAELTNLGRLCFDRGITIVSDEIHSDIIYRGYTHTVFAALGSEFTSKSIVCTGVSKTFNLAGLAISNIVIPDSGLRNLFHREVAGCGLALSNSFGLAAAEAAYRHGEPWLNELLVYLDGNLDIMVDYISRHIPAIKIIRPQGTYLAWLDCRSLPVSGERAKRFMIDEAKVGLEEGTIFGTNETGFWRMNFACPRSILKEALKRIEQAVKLIA